MGADFSRIIGKLAFPDRPRNVYARYAVAIFLPLLSILIANFVFTVARAPFFPLFTISVLVAAGYGGWQPGIVATAMSVLVNWLLVAPRFSLAVTDPENVLRIAVFATGGIGVSGLVGTIAALQQKLEIQRERYYVTLKSIGDAVIATDANGNVTFMNAVAEEVTGWPLSAARGEPLEEVFRIVNENTRSVVENPVRKVFESGRIVGLANHTVLVRRDGTEIPIDDSAAPIRDFRGKIDGAVLVFRDISQQRKSDAALLQAEKLASVGRLASTIAHEINNPLAAISNLLFLIKITKNWEQVERYASIAERELNRASEVTKQTLSFARRDLKPATVRLEELVDEIVALYSNKIEGNNIFVAKKCASDVSAFATKSEVRQVLSNLIGNAVDALPVGGVLHIRIKDTCWDGRRLARVVIADNGHGIPAKYRERVFDPFFTTKEDVGTGLGLWISKQILDRHDATIRIRSRENCGTVVVTCWPTGAPEEVTYATAP